MALLSDRSSRLRDSLSRMRLYPEAAAVSATPMAVKHVNISMKVIIVKLHPPSNNVWRHDSIGPNCPAGSTVPSVPQDRPYHSEVLDKNFRVVERVERAIPGRSPQRF